MLLLRWLRARCAARLQLRRKPLQPSLLLLLRLLDLGQGVGQAMRGSGEGQQRVVLMAGQPCPVAVQPTTSAYSAACSL